MNELTLAPRSLNSSRPLMKRCGKPVGFTGVLSTPAKDQTLLVIAPIVHPSGCTRATTEGPAAHFFVPSTEAVAVGIKNAGPTPQIIFPGFAGDKKKVTLRSPRPALVPPSLSGFWRLITGKMARIIRFHC